MYRKTYQRKYAPRTYVKKETDAEQSKKIARLEKKITSLSMTVESKYLSQSVNTYTNYQNGTPAIVLLNGMTQGVTGQTRVGNNVKFISIDLKINCAYGPTVLDKQNNSIRCILVREKPALGQAISFTSMFDTSPTYTFTQFENNDRDWKERFHILYDQTFLVNSQLFITEKNIRIKRKLGFVTSYARGNAGTIADIDTNSLYLLMIADSTTALSQYYRYGCQIEYQDA